jgi:transcriptional regulator with XRE-family HTH domain
MVVPPSEATTDLDAHIAGRAQALRQAAGLSLAELAARSGVSKAMISKVERGESSPTATLLGRLAAGLGVTLTAFLAPDELQPRRLRKRADQPVWRDPEIGYRRRQVAPLNPQTRVELVEVELPRGARIAYPRWSGNPYAQRLWVVEGALHVDYGEEVFDLDAGDSLDFGVDRNLTFKTLGARMCRYLLVIAAG